MSKKKKNREFTSDELDAAANEMFGEDPAAWPTDEELEEEESDAIEASDDDEDPSDFDDEGGRGAVDLPDHRHHKSHHPRQSVLLDDGCLLILDKPAWTRVEADASGTVRLTDTSGEDRRLAIPGEALLVYPMDEEMSGVLVLARSAEARERLRADLAGGALDLTCQAIVQAVLPGEGGMIDAPLREVPGKAERVRVDAAQGRPARTEWRRKDTFVAYALLECLPRSAQPCQIRAHLQHAGMPPAVDPNYGGAEMLLLSSFKAGYRRSRRRTERPLIERLSLHMASAALTHPATGERITVHAAMPKDFRAALNQLSRFGRIAK